MKNKTFIISIFLGLFFVSIDSYVLAQSCPSYTQYSFNHATFVGEIIDTGNENNVQAWFEWGLTSSLGNFTPQQNLYITSLPYRFCYTITNLNPCTTYYYRAVVKNSQGFGYGQTYSFITRCETSRPSLNISCYALPNPANVGSLVTFYSLVSGGTDYYSYEWSGSCTGYSSNCQRIFSFPGNYVATLKVTSGNETKYTFCSVNVNQATSSFLLSTNQSPVAVISFSPEKITPGTTVTFDASKSYDPDGLIVSYKWYINDKLVSNNVSFSRVLTSGTYRVKLVVTDNKNENNSKEILIYVGRNVYLTRNIIKTVSPKTPVKTEIKFASSPRLVDILLDHSYKLTKCSSSNIKLTLINNTSVNRQINISSNGEIKDWFEPQNRSFIVKPQSTQLVSWKVNVPCKIKKDVYEFVLKISTPGESFEKRGIFEVKTSDNPFTLFLSSVRAVPFIDSLLNNIWIIFLIILVLISYRVYRYLRNKFTQL